ATRCESLPKAAREGSGPCRVHRLPPTPCSRMCSPTMRNAVAAQMEGVFARYVGEVFIPPPQGEGGDARASRRRRVGDPSSPCERDMKPSPPRLQREYEARLGAGQ